MKTCITLFLSLLFFTFFTPEKQLKVDAVSSETMIKLHLNDGEKWQSDASTSEYIQSMIALCEQALSKRTYDAALLHDTLTKEIDLLNRNTQITGDSRAQLHNYQLGLRKRIEAISDNRGSVEWLLHELKRFSEYFE